MRERIARMEQLLINGAQERGALRQAVDELTMEVRQQFEGQDGRPGLTMRVDRLEQTDARRTRALWIIFAASIASLVTALWSKVTGR